MDMYDLDTATRHQPCRCGLTWYKLPDDRWLLVAKKGHQSMPSNGDTVARQQATRNNTRVLMYHAAKLYDDPLVHLRAHATTDYRLAHPMDGRLVPATGPSLASVLRVAEQHGIVPMLDKDGALVFGRLDDRRDAVVYDAAVWLRDHADLIRAHLAGESVACTAAAKCPEPADRLALPSRPICAKHAAAPLRDPIVPDVKVALPEPWPDDAKPEPVAWTFKIPKQDRGKYVAPGL